VPAISYAARQDLMVATATAEALIRREPLDPVAHQHAGNGHARRIVTAEFTGKPGVPVPCPPTSASPRTRCGTTNRSLALERQGQAPGPASASASTALSTAMFSTYSGCAARIAPH
jgi:hypothetical protein